MWAQFINIALGLMVMLAPGLWDYDKSAASNNYIAGPLVITFAIISITDVGRNIRWFNVPVGFWLLISPLVFEMGEPGIILNMLAGMGIVIFSLIKGKRQSRFGGGWRSLFQKHPLHAAEAEKMIANKESQ